MLEIHLGVRGWLAWTELQGVSPSPRGVALGVVALEESALVLGSNLGVRDGMASCVAALKEPPACVLESHLGVIKGSAA